MSQTLITRLVGIYASGLLILGALLLFLPVEMYLQLYADQNSDELAISMLGGALLAMGFGNWVGRESVLGGIYGKAILVGNQMFTLISTLLMLKRALSGATATGFWLVLIFFGLAALFFGYLQLTSPKLTST